jgi:hypothetical protein
MKHHGSKIILASVLMVVLLGGCTLMSSYFMDEYHFWTLMGGSANASRTLSYNSDGYTIVMSKGEDEGEGDGVTGYATQSKAAEDNSVFTLTVDGVEVSGENRDVEQLDDGAWHVVEDFHIDVQKGKTYTIKGKTTEGGEFVAEGTLKLKILSGLF